VLETGQMQAKEVPLFPEADALSTAPQSRLAFHANRAVVHDFTC
jgi:hypothetical protein